MEDITLSKYRTIFYKYLDKKNIWYLSDRDDFQGQVMTFNADKYRIDECLKKFEEERKGLTMCDYINHPSFIKIDDKGMYYEVLMKSVVFLFKFYSIDNCQLDRHFYIKHFYKDENKKIINE